MKNRNRQGLCQFFINEKSRSAVFFLASAVVLCGLTVILCSAVPYGIQNGDEAFCLSETHRLLLGDRPVTDIWSISQFSALFQYLPMRLYLNLHGSLEGVVLAMRYVYVGLKAVLFCFIVVHLRRYRWWALLAGVIVTAYHPLGFFTIFYYAVAVAAALAAGMLFFSEKQPSAVLLVAAGFLFSCCVLAEPLTAVVYFAYTALVAVRFLRNKRNKPFLEQYQPQLAPRTWGGVTGGVAAAAAVFFAVLLIGNDPAQLWKNLSSFFVILSFDSRLDMTEKLRLYVWQTGWFFNVAAILLSAVLLLFGKRLRKHRRLLTAAVCTVFIGLTATMFLKTGVRLSAIYLTDFKPVPVLFLGASSYLLTEHKNRRLFGFFLYGVACAIGMDVISLIAFGTGGIIAAPASLLLFRALLRELLAERRAGKEEAAVSSAENKNGSGLRRKVLADGWLVPTAALLAVLIASEGAYCFYARFFQTPESFVAERLEASIDRGPLKGLYTIPAFKEEYDSVLADMDTILKDPPESMFVMGYCAWANLYAQLPYACPAVYAFDSVESRDYLDYYWALYPERRAPLLYIPFVSADHEPVRDSAEEKLAFLKERCECTVTEGEIGYIVRVSRWTR